MSDTQAAESGERSRKLPPLADVLERAVAGDELALLQLTRHITSLLTRVGAYSARDDWAATVREIGVSVVEKCLESGPPDTAAFESLVKNLFWGRVLDLMVESHSAAYELFATSVRRVIAKHDGGRRFEDSWEDVVQLTAVQMLEAWSAGKIDRPWAMLCTIAKRRFLDLARGDKPTTEINDEILGELDEEQSNEVEMLPAKAKEILDDDEWQVIARMDLQGETRVEIAESLGLTEGKVLSLRRAGLRKLYRLLGSTLPEDLGRVWNEMFKGAKRAKPEEAAEKLGIPLEEVLDSLSRARELLSIG